MASGKKKTVVFWDKDGRDGGKSSIQVLLDWLTADGNYDKWRAGDRQNGGTKEVLCTEIVQNLMAVGITNRRNSDIREKISNLEKQFRDAREWLHSTGLDTADGGARQAAILRKCPYYYELQDVMVDPGTRRQSVVISDAASDSKGKKRKGDPVEELLAQQVERFEQRQSKSMRMIELREREIRLLEERNEREKVQAEADLAVKKVQLESAERAALVELLLTRKKLQTEEIPEETIDRLFPLPK